MQQGRPGPTLGWPLMLSPRGAFREPRAFAMDGIDLGQSQFHLLPLCRRPTGTKGPYPLLVQAWGALLVQELEVLLPWQVSGQQ